MQTNFTLSQLADPDTRASEGILRNCVHCGFCTATCPTYTLLGDELDSPRGRIYQIKDMLEKGGEPSPQVVKHVDRCLSCLSCMTTCPSGVHYMHLVDHARSYIEKNHTRKPLDRALRTVLAHVLPNPQLMRLALSAAGVGKKLGGRLAHRLPPQMRAMLDLAPDILPDAGLSHVPGVYAAHGPRRARVALLIGCAQRVLAPRINEATIRLLTRHGVEVVVSAEAECCGALTHHMGKEELSHRSARATINAWTHEAEHGGLDAVIINASGCGTTVKDYGFMFREDRAYAEKAARVAGLARDVTEFLHALGLMASTRNTGQTIAYHSACSLQHGQTIKEPPRALLQAAGFKVADVPDGHLCCGSAGTYNMLQPEIATQLRDLKVQNIERLKPDAIAAGNLGCMTQIGSGTALPIAHTVELLDWATGGPLPEPLRAKPAFADGAA
jgi:glycolate oxidase iron-sulfur subunit